MILDSGQLGYWNRALKFQNNLRLKVFMDFLPKTLLYHFFASSLRLKIDSTRLPTGWWSACFPLKNRCDGISHHLKPLCYKFITSLPWFDDYDVSLIFYLPFVVSDLRIVHQQRNITAKWPAVLRTGEEKPAGISRRNICLTRISRPSCLFPVLFKLHQL